MKTFKKMRTTIIKQSVCRHTDWRPVPPGETKLHPHPWVASAEWTCTKCGKHKKVRIPDEPGIPIV